MQIRNAIDLLFSGIFKSSDIQPRLMVPSLLCQWHSKFRLGISNKFFSPNVLSYRIDLMLRHAHWKRIFFLKTLLISHFSFFVPPDDMCRHINFHSHIKTYSHRFLLLHCCQHRKCLSFFGINFEFQIFCVIVDWVFVICLSSFLPHRCCFCCWFIWDK